MNSDIGTGRAKKEMRDGYLIRTIVRGLRRARWKPSVSVWTVVVGRKIAHRSWNIAAFIVDRGKVQNLVRSRQTHQTIGTRVINLPTHKDNDTSESSMEARTWLEVHWWIMKNMGGTYRTIGQTCTLEHIESSLSNHVPKKSLLPRLHA